MGHPLEAIDWRLERADEHLAALNDELATFANQEDRRIIGHFERDTSEYVFRFGGSCPIAVSGSSLASSATTCGPRWTIFVWQLVLLRGGSPTRRTEFPIYESRKRYARTGVSRFAA